MSELTFIYILAGKTTRKRVIQEITKHDGLKRFIFPEVAYGKFPDGEERVLVGEPFGYNNNNCQLNILYYSECSIFNVLFVIDALKRTTTNTKIHLYAPYLPYSRQDKTELGVPHIGAAVIAKCLAEVDLIYTLDAHSQAVWKIYGSKILNYSSSGLFPKDVERCVNGAIVVAPDNGSLERAHHMVEHLGLELAVATKERHGPGNSTVLGLEGDVSGKNCIIFDDIIDSGNTVSSLASILKNKYGADRVEVWATHAVMSGRAKQTIIDSQIDKVIVTDSVPHKTRGLPKDKFHVVSIAPWLSFI